MNLFMMIEKLGPKNLVGRVFYDGVHDEYLRIDSKPGKTKRSVGGEPLYILQGSFLIPEPATGLHTVFTPTFIEAREDTVGRRWEEVEDIEGVLEKLIRRAVAVTESPDVEMEDEYEYAYVPLHHYENTERSIEEELDDNDTLSEAIAGRFEDVVPLRARMLNEATDLTLGERNRVYGEPVENMLDIAEIFEGMTGIALRPSHVPLFHIATKLARLRNTPGHHDSIVDMMAYAGIYAECCKEEREVEAEWALQMLADAGQEYDGYGK